MRPVYSIPYWKTSPFIRMVLPLFSGIVLEWYVSFDLGVIALVSLIAIAAYFLLSVFTVAKRYKLRFVQGLLIQLIIISAGMLLTWNSDMRNKRHWFGHGYTSSDYLVVKIDEPPVRKAKSYKADATIDSIIKAGKIHQVFGKVILYFRDTPALNYGDRILIKKTLQPIKNTGNPAAFDYARYAAFQQKFHTVFLSQDEYIILKGAHPNVLKGAVFRSREHILNVLRNFVGKNKSITGIAEALLIGYKNDLDKDLMQAYSNTGVVHIIAISGLHLGLIYVMLNWMMNLIPWLNRYKTLRVIIILSCLWMFSILTGSSASVLRSALMFSCILIGKTYFKQSSTYNAIAASSFILVCYNPYFLWDVGFQLSYLAVLGIVWLQQPIHRLVFFRNIWLQKIWSMMAVTLAAQLAAFPLCIYYFHQFPNMFLITNIIAVPLSTLVLFAEIFLLCFSWVGIVGLYTGKFIEVLIELMNTIIIFCNRLPWSVTSDIYATALSTWVLYGIVFFICAWLLYRNKLWLKFFLLHMIAFASLHLYADISHGRQRKIIVYNIAKHQAIDLIAGNSFYFLGDSALSQPGLSHNFHIKPARIAFQARHELNNKTIYDSVTGIVSINGKRMLIVDRPVAYEPLMNKLSLELLIISHNPKLKIAGLVSALKPAVIVFDASNSLWKIEDWKKECSALLLPFHSVPEQGAFVLDLKTP